MDIEVQKGMVSIGSQVSPEDFAAAAQKELAVLSQQAAAQAQIIADAQESAVSIQDKIAKIRSNLSLLAQSGIAVADQAAPAN